MKHRLDTGFEKFQVDEAKGKIEIQEYSEEDIQIIVPGTAQEDYLVSCFEGFWRCECFDWNRWWKSTDKVGAYCCKHIEEAHYKIAKLKGIFSQSTLAEVVAIDEDEPSLVLRKNGICTWETGEIVRINSIKYRIVRFEYDIDNNKSLLYLIGEAEHNRRKQEGYK